MIIPIPALRVNLTFGNKTKETKERDKKGAVTKPAAQLQTNFTVDPVMLLMLMAIIFFVERGAGTSGSVLRRVGRP